MPNPSLIPGIEDFYLLLVVPIAAYWLSASIFHIFDCRRWFQIYKIHTYEDEKKRNKATLRQVFTQVLAQQAVQVIFALVVDRMMVSGPELHHEDFSDRPLETTSAQDQTANVSMAREQWKNSSVTSTALPEGVALALRFGLAIIVADFWQYFWHRIFHTNKFLYKHVHSVHHRIYVPYSYGALYSSLIEAFIVDTIGTTITFYLSGLSTLEATVFASLTVIKSVNDHSGYRFPCNPFDYLSKNTTEFHDVHHQSWGLKYNYSQIYLTIWDDLLGTTMPQKEVEIRRKRASKASLADIQHEKAE